MIRTANVVASVSRNGGGLFESVRRLVQSLAEIGMCVRVVGLLDEFSQEDISAWLPVWASALKTTWPADFGYSPQLVDEVISYRPDIIHSHGLWMYPSVATYCCFRKTRRPYIISPHGMLDPWALANSRWKKRLAHALYESRHLQNARCLRALCESEAQSMRESKLTNEIVVIPNGIDLPDGPPPGRPPWDGLVEPGTKILLYVGRIHPKKGIPNLIKAWAGLRGSVSDPNPSKGWVLAIAGWDQNGHEQELKQLAGARRIPVSDIRDALSTKTASASRVADGSIVFLGPQFKQAKAACFAHCDALVLPSLSEGLPMVALEAWAYSKPVLMTPQCNLPEGFSANAALEIKPNADSVGQGLQELLRMTDSERLTMGSRGRALVAERFVWPKISLQMKEVYEWMLGDGQKPACMLDS